MDCIVHCEQLASDLQNMYCQKTVAVFASSAQDTTCVVLTINVNFFRLLAFETS